jgi:hypothetical protein
MTWQGIAGTKIVLIAGLVLTRCLLLAAQPRDDALEKRVEPFVDRVISGLVRSDRGPLAGAVVRIQATTRATTTGADGGFSLSVAGVGAGPFNITAWARGYFSAGPIQAAAGRNDLEFRLKAHATRDNPDYPWEPALCPPGNEPRGDCCSQCHSRVGADLYPFLPVDEWVLDAHSRSAVNPRFRSMYTGDAVQPSSAFNSKRNRRDTGPGYKLDFPQSAGNCAACHVPAAAVHSPLGTDPTRISGVAMEGVTCDVCHKIWDVRLDSTTGLPFEHLPGVLSYEFRRPMVGEQFFAGPLDDVAPGVDTFSPLQQQSRFCAPCHYGSFYGTVVYGSFGEWLTSPYGDPDHTRFKTCQDCHMPTGRTCYFTLPSKGGRRRDPATVASHLMPGASDRELLRQAAALELTASRTGNRIDVEVRVRNVGAGHRLPTGSPLRHILILVEAKDEHGRALELSRGTRLPQWAGDLAGLAGSTYAKILMDRASHESPTAAFWKPTSILADTRLAPGETDIKHYSFALSDQRPVYVEACLIFRRTFQALARAKGWKAEDILMALASVTI